MKRYLLVALGLLSAPLLADEKGPEWNYFEAGYSETEFGNLEPNGAFGTISYLFNETMFVTAGWSSLTQEVDFDGSTSEIKLNESKIGMGMRFGINETTDFSASLGYVNIEDCYLSRVCDDDDGINVNVGVRTMFMDNLEVFVAADYIDAVDSNTSAIVGVAYNLTNDFSLKLSYKDSDDLEVSSISARFEF